MKRASILSIPPWIAVPGAVMFFAALLLPVDTPVSLDDGLRHLTMAREFLGNRTILSWQPFFFAGYFSKHAVDPWFLANVSYIPFAGFSDATALHLFSLTSIALLLVAFWRIIRPLALPSSWSSLLFLLLILGNTLFTLRLLLARPFAIMTVLTIVVLHAVLQRRVLLAGVSLAVAVLFSQLFVFPLFILFSGCLWRALRKEYRPACALAVAGAVAILGGVLLHPQTAEYLRYLALLFLKIPFLKRIDLGTEMYSGFTASIPVHVLLGSMVALAVSSRFLRRKDTRTCMDRPGISLVAALVVAFLLTFYVWERAIDFLWPLSLVLLAMLLSHERACFEEWFAERPGKWRWSYGRIIGVSLCLVLLLNAARIAFGVRAEAHREIWQQRNVLALMKPHARVLNPDWDTFPLFVSVRPDLRFATGIDPTFSLVEDTEGYALVSAYFQFPFRLEKPIIDGASWVSQLLEHYPADYLLLRKERGGKIVPVLDRVPGLTRLTESGAAFIIYAVKDTN